jgi:hypothetical protein
MDFVLVGLPTCQQVLCMETRKQRFAESPRQDICTLCVYCILIYLGLLKK